MKNGINYECDDCHLTATFKSREVARKTAGWAISWDYKYCWCPKCAPAHRFGKATEKNNKPLQLPTDRQQLKIENLG